MKTPGAVPTTEQAVCCVGSARKPQAPSQKPVLSGLAVESDPIGFWEGVGPDCAVATPLPPVTDNVGRAKKKKRVRDMFLICSDVERGIVLSVPQGSSLRSVRPPPNTRPPVHAHGLRRRCVSPFCL